MNHQDLQKKIQALISEMTLEEKISFASGKDFWHTQDLERLGIPSVAMSDGPHGLRKRVKQPDGSMTTVKATCFPPACAMANSWNPALAEAVGGFIGEECRAEQVSILLGPGMNIKRSPLCGRNFEYYSEDPYLSGKMASAFIRGVQGKGVAACAKHLFANSQETRRFSTDARVSERALHEIYLPSFEMAVREGHVQTVMHSYNIVNGEYAGENKEMLTDTLRGAWGFDGYVMSDWNATSDRVRAYAAGMNVEMPPSGGGREQQLLEAVRTGVLSEEQVDALVFDVLKVVFEHLPDESPKPYGIDAHHVAAARAVEECVVLLKNAGDLLPFAPGKPLAVIGGFAKTPRYQGGGSSHVEPHCVDDISAFVEAENGAPIVYAAGYDENHATNAALIAEAVEAAKACGRALIFAGLPDSYETEGRDRRHMHLPPAHDELIEAVTAACPNTAVILFAGSPAELPWVDRVPAILHAYLGGQALGSAIAKIVFGKVNPSGKLAETHPIRLEDNPSYLFFPGDGDICVYGEDIYVGYRYYDKKRMDVLFPFGHGLSYTRFAYTKMDVDGRNVSVTVKNIGDRAGKEVVELYVGAEPHPVTNTFIGNNSYGFARPTRWLCGFEKVELAPGEEKTVTITLCDRAFSVYDETIGSYRRLGGTYTVSAGASSRDLRLSATVEIENDDTKPILTRNTTIEDLVFDTRIPREVAEELALAVARPDFAAAIREDGFTADNPRVRGALGSVLRQMLVNHPSLTPEEVEAAVAEANDAMQK